MTKEGLSDQSLHEIKEVPKRGANVEICLKLLRHGIRDPKTNMLTDIGREQTRDKAVESGLYEEDFDYIKAIGSTAGPYVNVNEQKMGRALETAHIYANEIATDSALHTRPTDVLDYKKIVSAVPYDHIKIYNSSIPENFDNLSDKEKIEAHAKAQIVTVEHVLELTSTEADQYRKECAGSMAYLITHYQEVAHHLKSGKNALIPAGVHGNFMEFLMKAALIRKDAEGNEVRGFGTLDEIGGPHSTSEAFTVNIATDESGNNKPLKLIFDDATRPNLGEMTLDADIVKELSKFYKELRALRAHKE